MLTFDHIIETLTLLGALGCGLISGVFFAFSVFVMKALARLSPGEGIAAMQSINLAVINPFFLSVFLGTGLICAALMIASYWRWPNGGAGYSLMGGSLYVVGTLLVTMVCNVPRNNALAAVNSSAPEAAELWARYLKEWTAWNHLRTVAALAAALALTLAYCQ
jgi:uncharacterized membrane protein